jgi:aspartate/methionine/tyrosine aminotransferase
LREVNQLCQDHSVYHVHDEAYEYFVYDGARHFSPGSIPGAGQHTISLFSLSKAYGFASWRIGAMVVPERLITSVRKIQDTIVICAPVISQFAAIGALQAGVNYCRQRLKETRKCAGMSLVNWRVCSVWLRSRGPMALFISSCACTRTKPPCISLSA